MAKSKFEYVKHFESLEQLLPNCWIVVRIDGKAFHAFSNSHQFKKPNDHRGLNLMNACANKVMNEHKDIKIAYGQSDEYSFIFSRHSTKFRRRPFKFASLIGSLFSSCYVFYWNNHFGDEQVLQYPPCFDARAIAYPSDQNMRDYLSWRQADCHINNLYNTTMVALVEKGGLSGRDATEKLSGTSSSDKNEIMFKQFNMNYNNEPELFRKGTVLYRQFENVNTVCEEHCSIISDEFWRDHEYLLKK